MRTLPSLLPSLDVPHCLQDLALVPEYDERGMAAYLKELVS